MTQKKTTHHNIPKLRFPEFRYMGGWDGKKINEFLTESRIKGSKGDIAKKITVKLWGKGVFKKEGLKGSVNTQYYRRKKGQFIYSKLDFLNQAFGLIPAHLDNYESTVDLPCFDIRDGIDPTFLLEYVQRKRFYKKLGDIADGSRKAKRIHADTFLNFSIFLPSLIEQRKIADCLSSIDELISIQTQKLDTLKAYKKGLMQQLFPAEGETVPKLRFPEFKNAEAWEEKKMADVCIKIMDGTHFSPKSKIGSHLYLTSKNIRNGLVDLSNISYISSEEHEIIYSKCPVKKYDVLLTKDGANTGNCALNHLDIEFSLLSSVAVLRGNPLLIDKNFLYYLIDSEKIQRLIINSVSGQAITRITLKKIAAYSISLPTNKEQKKIADCLVPLDELIYAQAQKLETLKLHKKGLMQQLFPSTDEVNG
ncbi:type I restriction enzyme, S subunit [Desulfocicer vacuolatum DSM 3385]|uniref:Type I restriction enzyme, S subunit n=1 Tax=Desulfocicer vacuolatum DSM 3385 TaxID=1121400 RepID=A0A1W2CC11_9BACT|nr:restriction endonuclease subunit S [Desulfocicer vacuolatum]SMC82733.1 type I restriction enzyme, S subunit [Desulfocicer vacuolatum DSM 3385]